MADLAEIKTPAAPGYLTGAACFSNLALLLIPFWGGEVFYNETEFDDLTYLI